MGLKGKRGGRSGELSGQRKENDQRNRHGALDGEGGSKADDEHVTLVEELHDEECEVAAGASRHGI